MLVTTSHILVGSRYSFISDFISEINLRSTTAPIFGTFWNPEALNDGPFEVVFEDVSSSSESAISAGILFGFYYKVSYFNSSLWIIIQPYGTIEKSHVHCRSKKITGMRAQCRLGAAGSFCGLPCSRC